MNVICNVMIGICVTLASAGILALIAYVFNKEIKKIYFGSDLLPASRFPNIEISLGSVEVWEANDKYSLRLQNEGEVGVSRIRVFGYKNIISKEKSCIELLSKGIDYKWANPGCGEHISISLKSLDCFFDDNCSQERLFIEMIDNHSTIFCQTVYFGKDELEKTGFVVYPQAIKRLKKHLPNRKITKDALKLSQKYDIDVSVG